MKLAIATVLFMCIYFNGSAQNPDNKTKRIKWIKLLDKSASPGTGNLENIKWLQGKWIAESKNLKVEHIILEKKDAQMPGFVRSVRNDKISFYEITSFIQVGHSVHYRVKHFSAELEGWEAQDEYIDRPLVKIENGNIFFDGITFKKNDNNSFTVYFLFQEGARKGEVLEIDFRKVN